ncbi:MAG TPA: hypothetical protein VFK35_01365 [Candidatus Limnocylindrales bacterium]|nr:hypothetical protein [Candidatus Limnocylindrales bacterium]
MTHDHDATRLHRLELDRAIETIRTERLLEAGAGHPPGLATRGRQAAGRALIAAGQALVGGERGALRSHRA